MHWLRGIISVILAGSVVAACSSESGPKPAGSEPIGEQAQALTAACNTLTIGLPCDPDGPAMPKLECEGVCAIAPSGLVSCQAVFAGANDGVICGTTTGVGNAACKRVCSGKTCL